MGAIRGEGTTIASNKGRSHIKYYGGYAALEGLRLSSAIEYRENKYVVGTNCVMTRFAIDEEAIREVHSRLFAASTLDPNS